VAQHGGRRQPHGEAMLHVPEDDEQLRCPPRDPYAHPAAAPTQRTHPRRPYGAAQDCRRPQVHRGRLRRLHEAAPTSDGGPEIRDGGCRSHLAALDHHFRRPASYSHGQRPRV
jgi:hypothetical protein